MAARVERECRAQGVPVGLDDPAAINAILTLMRDWAAADPELERELMPESKKTRRPTEAEARSALRERILEVQASNTPMSDAEKAKVAQRDQGCPDVGREPHDQRVLARTELGLPPHVEEDLAALDPCHADRVHEDVVAWTIRSRVEQGLPPHIEDPVVLHMVARMLLEAQQRPGPSPRK